MEIKTDLFINETDMKEFISKGCCGCLTASVALFVLILLLLPAFFWMTWWANDLGNGLHFTDADGLPIITQGEDDLIPLREERYSNQEIEYVDNYKVSDDWLIVKTLKKSRRKMQQAFPPTKYYIVDKRFDKDTPFDSISANYVTCYTDSLSFVIACKERGVDVSW